LPLRIAIVGPGRVGSAFGHRLAKRGCDLLGFIGPPHRVEQAVLFARAGQALDGSAVARAHVVVFAVGDEDLALAVGTAVRSGPPRSCSLWLHTSGRHDLSVFDAAAGHGIRRGSLHPVAPFADAASGLRAMAGAPAVIDGDAQSLRLLRRLCDLLSLVPVPWAGTDRAAYHAGCALAANGLTALYGLCQDVFATAGGFAAEERRRLVDALMEAALRGCSEHGAVAALSGPVRRGDADVVKAHVQSLGRLLPDALPAYRALMQRALELAVAAGLKPDAVAAVQQALAVPESR
jgi:predicted short-subunit dehydrogenase-like oxidoreductase (DUF2520 family)